jgi:hypothetical protein
LLQPVEMAPSRERKVAPFLVVLMVAIPIAILLGVEFGEKLIGSLLIRA